MLTISESEAKTSERSSLFAALIAPLALALMTYLVETHNRDDIAVYTHYPVLKVMACTAIAGLATVIALLAAVAPAFQSRWYCLLWIIPLVVWWIWFVDWYDWGGLFWTGKAWWP